jgi:hypothetical protein
MIDRLGRELDDGTLSSRKNWGSEHLDIGVAHSSCNKMTTLVDITYATMQAVGKMMELCTNTSTSTSTITYQQ